MMLFRCLCGEELEAAENEAGMLLMCPVCKAKVIVPRPRQGIEAGPPPAVPPLTPPAVSVPDVQESGKSQNLQEAGAKRIRPISAIAAMALVCSLLAIFGSLLIPLLILACIPAIILGIIALVEIRRSQGRLGGKGVAIAGIVLGCLTPLGIILLIPVLQHVRENAARKISQNNLKQISLAMENYHDVDHFFPQQAIYRADGKPLLSWRVTILPYLGADDLFKTFKLDKPWDSPHNLPLIARMPSIYQMPGKVPNWFSDDLEKEFTTVYLGFVGKDTLFRFSHQEKVTRKDIKDGPAKTLAVVEASEGVPWTKPEDLLYQPDGPLPPMGGHFSNGFNAVLVDGNSLFIDTRRVGERTIRNAITISDGQPLGSDWPSP